jgi:RNA exonuclease 4
MVGIGPGGYQSSAARVTVIDWNGHILFDEHVQQTQPVTEYRTFVSGITEEDLQGATMSLDDCRAYVLQLLDNRILVGHALKNDLKVLDISHPWWLTRDTAKYEPFMQMRQSNHNGEAMLWPRKLKHLAEERLHQEIQVEGKPHSPYEDALAALDLYRSVQRKWEKVIQYKVEKTNQIRQQQLAQ